MLRSGFGETGVEGAVAALTTSTGLAIPFRVSRRLRRSSRITTSSEGRSPALDFASFSCCLTSWIASVICSRSESSASRWTSSEYALASSAANCGSESLAISWTRFVCASMLADTLAATWPTESSVSIDR